MSTKLKDLLQYLEEPKPSVEVRELHDGRTISSAEKRGLIMEFSGEAGRMFMRTGRGDAAALLQEDE